MKKSVIFALLCLCTNNLFSQQMLFDDIEIPGSRSFTDPDYWNKTNLFYCFRNYSSQFSKAESEQWTPRLVYKLGVYFNSDEGQCYIDAKTGRILYTFANYGIKY